MPHLGKDELVRVGGAGRSEIARMAAHLGSCPACRALAVGLQRDQSPKAAREVPLRTLLELAAFERETAIERLLARAEVATLRRLTKGAQKERVIHFRACRTPTFVDVLISTVRAPEPGEEAEFLASLAALAARGMDVEKERAGFRDDTLATIWTEAANARRLKGEWQHAHSALRRAEEHLLSGTGNAALKARWLSILASLRNDQGERDEAMARLEECRRIYEGLGEWPLLARTLVQMAHFVVDEEPMRGLDLLDRADLYIPLADAGLLWLAASLRTECFITLGRVEEAFHAFGEAERLRSLHHRPNARLRSTFTAARLLEAAGRMREAEALFDEAVAGSLEAGLFNEALLDLLYVVGFHARQGSPERAADRSLRAFDEMEREQAAVHEQLRSVFDQLIEAARGEALDARMLAQARDYLHAHWKHPAAAAPVLSAGGREAPVALGRATTKRNGEEIQPLLARALWARLRREARQKQRQRIADSPECRTRAFVAAILADVRAGGGRGEAEFVASLGLTAARAIDESDAAKHALQSEIWIEVGNVCRRDTEWHRARVALRHAEEHLAHASENLFLKARMQSVAASLCSDQGHTAEAVALLTECEELYEKLKAWPLLARTWVQMAHTLVDSDPRRSLALVEKALPIMPATDPILRWLAESIRTESFIELREIDQALQAFYLAESLRAGAPRGDASRRSSFTAARLLEGLGYAEEAVQLFEAVIAEEFEHEDYQEAFLDLLYVLGLHLRRGATERAVALCRHALAQLELYEVGHEQLRTVWLELMEAARRRTALRLEALADVRRFLQAHFKYPAAKAPSFSLG